MTDQIETAEDAMESSNTLLSGLRRVLMAGIGAVVLTQEQIEDFVGKLVERGEIADGDAHKLINDIVERRSKMMAEGTRKIEEEYDRRIGNLLSRMNIPSKAEIDSLSEKIAGLSRKVDELNQKGGN